MMSVGFESFWNQRMSDEDSCWLRTDLRLSKIHPRDHGSGHPLHPGVRRYRARPAQSNHLARAMAVHQFEAKRSGTPVSLGNYALDKLRQIGLLIAR